MVERPMTEAERERAQAAITDFPILFEREIKVALIHGVIVGGALAALLIYVANFLHDVNLLSWGVSTEQTAAGVCIGAIMLGIISVRAEVRRDLANHAGREAKKASIRQDLERGVVWDYSGNVKESFLNTQANPEHPDLVIRFVDGNEVVLNLHDQTEHNLFKPPKVAAEVVILPTSQVVLRAGRIVRQTK